MASREVMSLLQQRGGPAGATRGAVLPARDMPSRLNALQRTAGNQATLAALRLATPRRGLMRCHGGCQCTSCSGAREHDDVVDEGKVRIRNAVASRTIARASGRTLARAGTITSPRFLNEPLLEDCFEDRARMDIGASDTSTAQPVSKLQQALVDWAATRPLTLDLGSTGPGGSGVDGVYGSKTAAAVMLFKTKEQLGSEDRGDVGPGTMHRLNELFPAAQPTPNPPVPPSPPTPPPNPDAQKIRQAKDDRDAQLRRVTRKLDQMAVLALRAALTVPGEGPVPTVQAQFPREVCVIQFWLNALPSDPDYWDTLVKARDLVERDRTSSQPLIERTGADCIANPAHGWSQVGNPAAGTQLCDMWFDSDSQHCRSDVLIHETYHTLGAHLDGVDFPNAHTPDDAFDNADTLTQFGNDLIGLAVDNCGHTARSGTAATAIANCVAALNTSS